MKKFLLFFAALSALAGLTACESADSAPSATLDANYKTAKVPTKALSESVLTDAVKKQLGDKIVYNGAGSFDLNGGKSTLDARVSSAPYATNTRVSYDGQLGVANAWLSKATRQYQNRSETSSNGKSNSATIKPAGWHQMAVGKPYQMLYNRGHLIAYALAGGLKSFDASEANPDNIASQTAWANQASNGDRANRGQNYYETQVRKALDNGKKVRYQVTPIYRNTSDKVPVGNHIQAMSSDGFLNFNVFVPNVEPGVEIDYATGVGKLDKSASSENPVPSVSSSADKRSASSDTSSDTSDSSVSTSDKTVYVASHGRAKVYWYDKADLLKAGAKGENIVQMPEKQAVAEGKHHSAAE